MKTQRLRKLRTSVNITALLLLLYLLSPSDSFAFRPFRNMIRDAIASRENNNSVAARPSGTTSNDSLQTILINNLEREFIVHVPPQLDTYKRTPLVIVLHGGGGTAQGMVGLSGFDQIADQHKCIVVYPNALQRHWNDDRVLKDKTNYDDVGFIATLIEKMIAEYNVDPKRVYVTGISNGGFFSERLTLELPDKIAASAIVAAGLTTQLEKLDRLHKPTPILLILGTEDRLVPFNGGKIGSLFGFGQRGFVLPAKETIKFWVNHNRCSCEMKNIKLTPRDPSDPTRIEETDYQPTGKGQEVCLYTVIGGGHTWPSGRQYLPERLVGKTTHQLTNEDLWLFFQDKYLH